MLNLLRRLQAWGSLAVTWGLCVWGGDDWEVTPVPQELRQRMGLGYAVPLDPAMPETRFTPALLLHLPLNSIICLFFLK